MYVGNPALNAFSGRFISRLLKSSEIHDTNLEVNNLITESRAQKIIHKCIGSKVEAYETLTQTWCGFHLSYFRKDQKNVNGQGHSLQKVQSKFLGR